MVLNHFFTTDQHYGTPSLQKSSNLRTHATSRNISLNGAFRVNVTRSSCNDTNDILPSTRNSSHYFNRCYLLQYLCPIFIHLSLPGTPGTSLHVLVSFPRSRTYHGHMPDLLPHCEFHVNLKFFLIIHIYKYMHVFILSKLKWQSVSSILFLNSCVYFNKFCWANSLYMLDLWCIIYAQFSSQFLDMYLFFHIRTLTSSREDLFF